MPLTNIPFPFPWSWTETRSSGTDSIIIIGLPITCTTGTVIWSTIPSEKGDMSGLRQKSGRPLGSGTAHPALLLPRFSGDPHPELYAGYDRGRLGNGTGYHPDTSFLYHGTSLPEGIIKLGGRWIAHADHLSSGSRSGKPPSTLTVLYHGTGVNAVLKRSSGSKNGLGDPVLVLVDGKPVPRLFSGKDLQGQGSGMKGDSRLSVLQARMYAIVSGQRFGAHRLDLFFLRKGTEVYTLTFNP